MKKKLILLIVMLVLAISLIYSVSSDSYPQVDRSSFDQIWYTRMGQPDFDVIKDGELDTWLPENPQILDKQKVANFGMYGWAGDLDLEIDTFGYSVDDGPFVPGNFARATEPVIQFPEHGGPYASRFLIVVPLADLDEGEHVANALVKLSDGNIYNISSMPFTVLDEYPYPHKVSYDGLFEWLYAEPDQTIPAWADFPDWIKENPLVYGARKVIRISVYGWATLGDVTIESGGYSIDDGPYITDPSYIFAGEEGVQHEDAGGPNAMRYWIHIPLLDLPEGEYDIRTFVKGTNGTLYELTHFPLTITERTLQRAHIEHLFRNYDFPTYFYEGPWAPFGNRTSHLDPLDYFFYKEDTNFINLYGWTADDFPITAIGYKVNDGPLVKDDGFMMEREPTLIELAGENSMRFNVGVPVSQLGTGIQKVAAWASLSTGQDLEISSFSFVYLDTDAKSDYKGSQVRKKLVPRRLQNGELDWDDMRQGLRFLFHMPELALYSNDNGDVEIVNDGALVALSPDKLSFEEMDGNVQVQNGLININVKGIDYRSAYIYNIPYKNRNTTIYARPYFEISANGETFIIYGDIQEKSVTEVYNAALLDGETFSGAVNAWWN